MIKVTIKDKHDILKQFKDLPDRMEGVRVDIGNTLSGIMTETVKSKIPNRRGWLRIYRNAINFFYDGKEWVVAGDAVVDIDQLDSNTILVKFDPADKGGEILSEFGEWPLDLVPTTDSSYTGNIKIKSASLSEIEAKRKYILPKLSSIRIRLGKAGLGVSDAGLPKFNGKITADLVQLSRKLEYGIAPFSKQAHWVPAVTEIENIFNKTLISLRSRQRAILTGTHKYIPHKTSADLKEMIKSAKKWYL